MRPHCHYTFYFIKKNIKCKQSLLFVRIFKRFILRFLTQKLHPIEKYIYLKCVLNLNLKVTVFTSDTTHEIDELVFNIEYR